MVRSKSLVAFAKRIGAHQFGRTDWRFVAKTIAKMLAELGGPDLFEDDAMTEGGGGRPKQNDDEALALEVAQIVWQGVSVAQACRYLEEGRAPTPRPHGVTEDAPAKGWFREEDRWKGVGWKALEQRFYRFCREEKKRQEERAIEIETEPLPQSDEDVALEELERRLNELLKKSR